MSKRYEDQRSFEFSVTKSDFVSSVESVLSVSTETSETCWISGSSESEVGVIQKITMSQNVSKCLKRLKKSVFLDVVIRRTGEPMPDASLLTLMDMLCHVMSCYVKT